MSGSFFYSFFTLLFITGFIWRYCTYLDFTTLLINTYLVSTLSLSSRFVDYLCRFGIAVCLPHPEGAQVCSTSPKEATTCLATNSQDSRPLSSSSSHPASSPLSSSTPSSSNLPLSQLFCFPNHRAELHLVCHS